MPERTAREDTEPQAAAPVAAANEAPADPGTAEPVSETAAEPGAGGDTPAAGGAGTFEPAMPIDAVSVASNIRRHFDEEALAELAADVKANGILQPLLVRPVDMVRVVQADGSLSPGTGYVLVAGERRLRAARLAGLSTVPVLIRPMDARTAARAQLLENVHRSDLNAIEEAEGYGALLRDHGYTQTALAKELGVSQPHIANRLQLLKLPEPARDLISRGMLAAATALALVRLADAYPDAAAAAAKEMVTAKVASAKAYEWVEEWLGSNMRRLDGWDAQCCGDHGNCPCRRLAKRFGGKVAVCMDPSRFAQVEEEARRALIEKAAGQRPQAVAPEPVPPPPSPDEMIPGVRVRRARQAAAEEDPIAAEAEPGAQPDGDATEGEGAEHPDAATPAKPTILDLRMLPSHTYTYLNVARGDDAPEACRACPCLRLAQRAADGRLEWVCIDPRRHQAEERKRTRERNKQAMQALKTERERAEQWAIGRVQESWNVAQDGPALGKVDLAYVAVWILTAAKPAYDPRGKARANLREYLAGYGVEIENAAAPYHSHAGLASKLLSLQPQTLWRLCIEWPLVAADHGLGSWYRRKVDVPEGEACDLCAAPSDDLEPFYRRRPDLVPAGVEVLACPKCRDLADLGALGFYQDPPQGVDIMRVTREQIEALQAAEAREDAKPRGVCSLCADEFRADTLQRFYNHRWDGAAVGAYMDVCGTCRVDREDVREDGERDGFYGFLPVPPSAGAGGGMRDGEVAALMEQEADGEIERHLRPAGAAEPTGERSGAGGDPSTTQPASASA